MALFLGSCTDRSIIIQLLQTATLLAHNLRQEKNKDYLLKSTFFTQIILQPFDFTDEEIVENYMSYIRGLATNISKQQLISLLLNNSYALFTGAMMFFNYKDQLIRTLSRTVILTVIKSNF